MEAKLWSLHVVLFIPPSPLSSLFAARHFWALLQTGNDTLPWLHSNLIHFESHSYFLGYILFVDNSLTNLLVIINQIIGHKYSHSIPSHPQPPSLPPSPRPPPHLTANITAIAPPQPTSQLPPPKDHQKIRLKIMLSHNQATTFATIATLRHNHHQIVNIIATSLSY